MHVNVTNPSFNNFFSFLAIVKWTSPCVGCRNHSSNTYLVNVQATIQIWIIFTKSIWFTDDKSVSRLFSTECKYP